MPSTASIVALSLAVASPSVYGFGTLCGQDGKLLAKQRKALPADAYVLQPNTTVAYHGDMGFLPTWPQEPQLVLQVAKRNNADFMVILGDFDYISSPDIWRATLDGELAPDFPVFASIGNHDVAAWDGYVEVLQDRLRSSGTADYCWGEIGVNQACMYKGILNVMSGVGERGTGHIEFMDETFRTISTPWKVGNWHKNQKNMQIGSKGNQAGWEVYEMCARHGAMVATGHEHSYCRTHLMSSFERGEVVSESNTLELALGQSFGFVSGVGGSSIRDWDPELVENPWWASVGALNNFVERGTVICTYYIENDPNLAECKFETVDGRIWDSWRVRSRLPDGVTASKQDQGCTTRLQELAVSHARNDALEYAGGVVSCDGANLDPAQGTVALRFENVDLDSSNIEQLTGATLQLYGFADGNEKAQLNIRAELGASEPLACGLTHDLTRRKTTKAEAVWTQFEGETTGWPRHEIWDSVELTDVLAEAVSAPGWVKGSALTLIVQGMGGARQFYSSDGDACLTPHLSLQLQTC